MMAAKRPISVSFNVRLLKPDIMWKRFPTNSAYAKGQLDIGKQIQMVTLTSNISSSCFRFKYEPSAKVRVLSTQSAVLEICTSQTSKKPNFIKMSWSSWVKSENPGIRFANSTTRWMHGVMRSASCSQSSIFWTSKLSDTEPTSGDEEHSSLDSSFTWLVTYHK